MVSPCMLLALRENEAAMDVSTSVGNVNNIRIFMRNKLWVMHFLYLWVANEHLCPYQPKSRFHLLLVKQAMLTRHGLCSFIRHRHMYIFIVHE